MDAIIKLWTPHSWTAHHKRSNLSSLWVGVEHVQHMNARQLDIWRNAST